MSEGSSQVEARRAARKDVWLAFEIDGRETPAGDSIDHLSLTGAFIRTVEPLPPKTRLEIRITAPKSGDVHRFDAEVIRTIMPDDAPKLGTAPGMGIEFLDLGAGSPRPSLELIIDEQEQIQTESEGAKTGFQMASGDKVLEDFMAAAEDATYYAILGVSDPTVDARQLKKMYYRRCKQFHPDRFRDSGPVVRGRAEEAYQLLTAAYETLSDPEKRAAYDAEHGIAETVMARRQRVQQRLEAALAAERAGRIVRAAIEAKLALAVDPSHADAQALLDRIQAKQTLFLT